MQRSVRPLVRTFVVGSVIVAGCLGGGVSVSPGRESTSPATVPSAPRVTPVPSGPAVASPTGGGGGCATAFNDFGEGARGPLGDPIRVARDGLRGLLASDVVTLADESTARDVTVLIARDGQEIGSVHLVQDAEGGWLLDTATLCGGLAMK